MLDFPGSVTNMIYAWTVYMIVVFPTFFQKAVGMAATLPRAKTKFNCYLSSVKGSSITRYMRLGF